MAVPREARAEPTAMLRQPSPSAPHATAGQIALWGALMVAVLWLSMRGWGSFQLGVYQDDATYTVLARSLAGGGPYGLINEPGMPSPPRFGFGFPLLLAPVVKVFPNMSSRRSTQPYCPCGDGT